MNFDERDSHWESLLQDKANLSQSFMKDTCCKTCLCLELLKLSACTDSCYRPQEEADLVTRLLSGILDPDTFTTITDKLRQHFSNLSYVSTLQEKITDLELSVKRQSQKMIDLNISSHIEKINKADKAMDSSKLESLIKRIESYEETLTHLRKENEELRGQLKKAISIYEDSVNANRKSAGDLRSELEFIREEQNKLRNFADSISKSINDNAAGIKEVKSIKENPRDEGEFKAFKLQIAEEVKDFNEKTQATIKKIQDSGFESEKKIDETWSQIQDLKKEHESIVNWQKECKTLSRHSSHLLTAADSVFSSLQQMQEFVQFLDSRLEALKKDMEIRIPEKKSPGDESYNPSVYGSN